MTMVQPQLLFELSSPLLGISHIGTKESFLWTSSQIISFHNFTNEVSNTLDLLDFNGILDCVYYAPRRSYLVLFSGNTFAEVPMYGKVSGLTHMCTSLPYATNKLHLSLQKDRTYNHGCGDECIINYCNGLVMQMSLADTAFPASIFPYSSTFQGSVQWVCSQYYQGHMIWVTSNAPESTTGSKRSKPSKSKGPSKCQLHIVAHEALPSAGEPSWSTVTDGTVCELPVDSSVMSMCVHPPSDSFSVLLRDNNPTQTLWRKYDLHGVVLMQHSIIGEYAYCCGLLHSSSEHMYLYSSSDHFMCWDVRYGVQVAQVAFGQYKATKRSSLTVGPLMCFDTDAKSLMVISCSGDNTSVSKSTYPSCVSASGGGKRSLLKDILARKCTNDDVKQLSTENCVLSAEQKVIVSKSAVLSQCTSVCQRDLLTVWCAYQVQLTTDATASVDKTTLRPYKHNYGKGYLEINANLVTNFLRELCAIIASNSSMVKDLDWELLHSLCLSRLVSAAQYPNIIIGACQCGRVDVLVQLLQSVTDLSERECVQILNVISCNTLDVTEPSLAQFYWHKEEQKVKYHPSAPTSAEKSKKKSRKSGAAVAVSGEGGISLTPLLALRLGVEKVLLRESAYSPVILTETLKAYVRPQMFSVYLRVFAHLLSPLQAHSHCCVATGDVYLHQVNDVNVNVRGVCTIGDDQICRAISWVSSLLDSSFTTLALSVSADAATRQAIARLLGVVTLACDGDSPTVVLDQTLGHLTHVIRHSNALKQTNGRKLQKVRDNNSSKGTQVLMEANAAPVPSGAYQLERLVF